MHALTLTVTGTRLQELFALGAKYLEVRLERAESRARDAEAQLKVGTYPRNDYSSPQRALFEAQLERSEITQQLAAFTWATKVLDPDAKYSIGVDDIDAIAHGEVARMRGLREIQ